MQTDEMHNRICIFAFFAVIMGFVSAGTSSAAAQTGDKSNTAIPGVSASQPSRPKSNPLTQSGSFTVSQLGHTVGTADYLFAAGPTGLESTSTVRVSMQGLDYALSKTEQLDQASHIQHVQLSATVNDSAVNVTGKPDSAQFLLNISSNGHSSTTRLAGHIGSIFLPDFDPGGLETLLTLAAAQNGRDLWAIVPKQAGSVESVQLATYADEHGTLNGQAITAHHLIATIAGTDTDLFCDPDNQLLQAELPQQGFSLIRKGFVLAPPKKPAALPSQ